MSSRRRRDTSALSVAAGQSNTSVTKPGIYSDLMAQLATLKSEGDSGLSDDLITNPKGNIEIGAYVLTPTGLTGGNDATIDDWRAVGRLLARLEGSIQWLIGDWFLHAESQWGKTYDDVALETGYSKTTLKDYAYVARGVELSVRTDQLTFGHHKIVAALDSDRQRELLQTAITQNLSIAQFREEVEGKKIPVKLAFKFSDEVIQWESIFAKKVVRLRNAIGKKQHLTSDEVRKDALDVIQFAQRLLEELDNQ